MLPPGGAAREASTLIAAVIAVVLLGAGVTAGAELVRLDLALLRLVGEVAFDGGTAVVLAITAVGGTQGALIATGITASALLALRRWHAAVAVVVSVAATQAIVDVIKSVVERARPPATSAHVEAAGYAFPSAHAATSMALYGLLALVAVSYLRGRARVWACTAALLVVAVVGLSRVYLGAHYPTDVVAGWLVGAIAALVAWRLAGAARRLAARGVPSAG
jgi:membrane-associated phospholipid phosphatase